MEWAAILCALEIGKLKEAGGNERFDGLVREAACVADPVRRMLLYHAADRILVQEETAILPLFYAQGRILVKPWVTMPRVPSAPLNLKEIILEEER